MTEESISVDKAKLSYNLDEAAAATGYSSSTLRIAIRRHDLIARYANSKPVILVDELLDWLKALPTEPKGGRPTISQFGEDDPDWPSPPEHLPTSAKIQPEASCKALFRTPEEVAPELGLSKSGLRQFARQTGFHTRIGKKIMLHQDDVDQLIVWIRERQDKADQWWTEPERDHFA